MAMYGERSSPSYTPTSDNGDVLAQMEAIHYEPVQAVNLVDAPQWETE